MALGVLEQGVPGLLRWPCCLRCRAAGWGGQDLLLRRVLLAVAACAASPQLAACAGGERSARHRRVPLTLPVSAGAQLADPALLAAAHGGAGSIAHPCGWSRAACGCQALGSLRSRPRAGKMQPAHVGLGVEHEVKPKGENNIFFHASLCSLCGSFTYK